MDEQRQQPIPQPVMELAVTGENRVSENCEMIGVNASASSCAEVAMKRKRGRPPRGTLPCPRPPPVKRMKDEEDVCFICFDGGALVLCDHRGCPKAYHPACVKRGEEFFRATERWSCGWHLCNDCGKSCHYMCYTCTYSLCKGCTQKEVDFVSVRGNKGLCGACMRIIVLIENSARGIKCEVDFDDKSSWEYLFKVYWMYLKGKLSLNFDEVLRAKSPWKGVVRRKVDHDSENYSPINKKAKGNIWDTVLKNQISPNEMAIHDDTNAGVVRLGVSGVPNDILSLLHSTGMEQAVWHYQDPTGKVHGPFSMLLLHKWKGTGYLPPDLRIWSDKQEKSILLTDALSWKCSQHVALPLNHEQKSLGASVTLENKDNSQDGLSIATRSEVCANNQIVKLIGEEKVADICTQSNAKESFKSNGHTLTLGLTIQGDENITNVGAQSNGRDEYVKSNGGHTHSPGLTKQGDGKITDICTQSNGKDESVKSNGGQTPSPSLTILGDGNITDICTQPNGKDESVKSNNGQTPSPSLSIQGQTPSPGLNIHGDGNISDGQSGHFERREESPKCEVSRHVAPDLQPALPSTAFDEKLNDKPLNKVMDGNGNEEKLEENGNLGSNGSYEGPSNSGQSDHKQSDNEENSGQSSGQNWRGPDVVHPPMDAPSWLAAIFGETDFSSLVDDSVSDLLEQVEANQQCGELESPAELIEWDDEFTEGAITDCFGFAKALSPMLDAGKGDAQSSSDVNLLPSNLQLLSQSTATGEPFQQADVHNHQVIGGKQTSKPPETEPTFSGISWNPTEQFSWDPTR